jgi:hypothetical protein
MCLVYEGIRFESLLTEFFVIYISPIRQIMEIGHGFLFRTHLQFTIGLYNHPEIVLDSE